MPRQELRLSRPEGGQPDYGQEALAKGAGTAMNRTGVPKLRPAGCTLPHIVIGSLGQDDERIWAANRDRPGPAPLAPTRLAAWDGRPVRPVHGQDGHATFGLRLSRRVVRFGACHAGHSPPHRYRHQQPEG